MSKIITNYVNLTKKYNNHLYLIRTYNTKPDNQQQPSTIEIGNHIYETDDWTNITPKILSYIGLNKHLQKNHPLSIIRQRIVNYFYSKYTNTRGNPLFSVFDKLQPIVTIQQNFDNLLIPIDHPSRAKSDCYYINKNYLLRAHTTAHQADLIKSGLDNFLMIGDVYRRDEIDSTHFPVFHQLDAVRLINREKLFEKNEKNYIPSSLPDDISNTSNLEIFENSYKINKYTFTELNSKSTKCLDQLKQPCHTLEAVKLTEYELKTILTDLIKDLFNDVDNKIQTRWVNTYFPFTQPSWELEIFYKNEWLEILGCGIIRNEILQNCGVKNSIGYAFGIGLERLAMILFNIPDIRLFWSNDTGFLNQFNETNLYKLNQYKPISIYPQCKNDLSFWLPNNIEIEQFCVNDFYDLTRTIGGDVIEQVSLVDKFKHPKNGKSSLCFRITYRHMERTLTQTEVNEIHKKIADACVQKFNVQIR